MEEEKSLFTQLSSTVVSVTGAAILVVINLALMLALADTTLTDLVLWSYEDAPFSPMIGFIVMSGILTIGRVVSYTALGFDPQEPGKTRFPGSVNTQFAIIGLIITMLAYGLFGGAALSLLPDPNDRIIAVTIATAITVGVCFFVGGVEIMTERSLAPYGRMILAFGFGVGIVFVVLTAIFNFIGFGGGILGLVAFGFILLGWFGDLVHEISVLTRDDRSALVNAYSLYAAVTGFLVHILLIVVEAMAE